MISLIESEKELLRRERIDIKKTIDEAQMMRNSGVKKH